MQDHYDQPKQMANGKAVIRCHSLYLSNNLDFDTDADDEISTSDLLLNDSAGY